MRVYRVLAVYRATKVMLLIRARDWKHARLRARYWQRDAVSYRYCGETADPHDVACAR